MLKNLTKEIVNQLNYFLSTDDWPKEWGCKCEWFNKEIKGELNEVEILKMGLARLKPLCKMISKHREMNEEEFYYKYNVDSHGFSTFRLLDHRRNLNDNTENKWFNHFVKVFIDRYNQLPTNDYVVFLERSIENMSIHATYVTTSLSNHRFMVANYGKKYVAYDKKSVNEQYDNQFSDQIKPIRGFVRYNHEEKDELVAFIGKILENNKECSQLLLLIVSVFFKGNCMSCEAEYRFILLSQKKNVEKHVDLAIAPSLKKEVLCDCSLMEKSKFYTDHNPSHKECETTKCMFDAKCDCLKEEL